MNVSYSVIIPAYNPCYEELTRAIRSVLRASKERNIEIIIVDDGSKEKVKLWKNKETFKNECIKIVSQENRGVSSARNSGIDFAIGDYVLFLDADDELYENVFEELDKIIIQNSIDVVSFGFTKIKSDKKNNIIYEKIDGFVQNLVYDEFVIDLCNVDNSLTLCWNKAYKRKFLNDNNLKFDIELKYAEDAEFVLKVYMNTRNIYNLPKSLYKYYVNENSVSQSFNPNLPLEYIKSMKKISKIRKLPLKGIDHVKLDHLIFTLFKNTLSEKNGSLKNRKKDFIKLVNSECYKKSIEEIDFKQFSFIKKVLLILIKSNMFYSLLLFYYVKKKVM